MMKRFLLLIGSLLILMSVVGAVQAQDTYGGGSVGIERVSGLYAPDTILAGGDVRWILRVRNDSFNMAITNGFRVFSPDGATWDTTVGDTLGWRPTDPTPGVAILGKADFDIQFAIQNFSTEGSESDTVGFIAAKIFSLGLRAGFNDTAFAVEARGIDKANHGKTLCIDSSWFRPGGTWKWAAPGGVNRFPAWSGQKCYTIFDPDQTGGGTLQVDPTSLAFTAVAGGANPANQSFDVTEQGGGAIDFAATEDSPWLSLHPTAGNTPGTVGVAVDIAALSVGTYKDTITVASTSAGNSPLKVEVVVTITAPKLLSVTPDTLFFTGVVGGANPISQNFNVAESGGGAIAFTATESTPWIALANASGSTPQDVTVDISTVGLTEGTLVAPVTVTAAEAQNSPQTVFVSLTMTASPKSLAVSPDTLFFTAQEGGANPTAKWFQVTETGGAGIAYIASESVDWLTLTDPAGTTPDSVGVNPVIAGLTPATYVTTVEVSSLEATNSPQTRTVVLTITASPKTIVAAPDSLFFTATAGGSNPPPQSFSVSELGGAVIDYTASESSPWASLTNATGNTPATVDVNVDITGVLEGTYFTKVAVSSTASATADSVIVQLTVTSCPVLAVDRADEKYTWNIVAGDVVSFVDTLALTSSSSDQIDWSVRSIPTGWSVDLSSGTTPSSVVLTVIRAFETVGTFEECLVLNSSGCDDSAEVCLNVVVTEPPCVTIQLSDTDFVFTAIEGDLQSTPASHAAAVSSSDGNTNFEFTASVPVDVTWLQLGVDATTGTSVSGVTPKQLVMTPLMTGLTAGTYETIVTVQSTDPNVCEPGLRMITVKLTVDEFVTPSADTVSVATVPASPGQIIDVAVNLTNSCNTTAGSVSLSFDPEMLYLSSVDFTGSRVGGASTLTQVIDNTAGTVTLSFDVESGDAIAPGSGLWATLEFIVSPDAGIGFAAVTTVSSATLTHDCGTGSETVAVAFVSGGVLVDLIPNSFCGWVVDEVGNEIAGATVELWGNYADNGPLATTTSSEIGSFFFEGVFPLPFDLVATKEGYMPGLVFDQDYGCNGVKIVLEALDDLIETPDWVDYYCSTMTWQGAPLPVGSVVEAFDPDGVLAGRQIIEEVGLLKFMPVYRDSAGSPEDEGATTGDVIKFYINGYPAIATGDVTYPSSYAQVNVCLDGAASTAQECQLMEGWNLISWHMDTESNDITDVLGPIMDCIEVVLGFEGGGLTYDPDLEEFSTLWNVDHLSGYWVKVKQGCSPTLAIEGQPVAVNTAIAIFKGWNLVSYLPTVNLTPEEALASLGTNVIIAYGSNGGIEIYKPGQSEFNTLDELSPCHGYWIKSTAYDTLVYPGGGEAPIFSGFNAQGQVGRLALGSGVNVDPTMKWINLYARNLTLNGRAVEAGTVITAKSASGATVGAFQLTQNGKFGFMPVYAMDPSESGDGLRAGEKFTLAVNGVETNEEFTWTNDGDRLELANLTAKGTGSLPTEFSLAQNYPNPFNPTTTISFSLPSAGKVRLEVYNILGARVATLFDGDAEAGEVQVVWDGRDSQGSQVASGVYLYRLTAGSFSETKKMMLLK